MKRNLTLLTLSLLGFLGTAIAQQPHPTVTEMTVAKKQKPKPVSYNQSKVTGLWGANASVGVAAGEFQNGFTNGTSTYDVSNWTAFTVSDANGTPGNAFWTRTLTGVSQGLFAGGMTPIASPTQANGCAIFDSGFLDNAGSALGSGSSPGPHEGWLVSPRFDLTGYTDSILAARFYCSWRNFNVSDFTASLSVDDGATWQEVSIRSLLFAESGESSEGWVKAIFPTATFGVINMTQCRLRFRFSGYYYYAMIDDVTIETLPYNDLTIAANDPTGTTIDAAIQNQIMNNRHIPIGGIEYPRDFIYAVNVQNNGHGAVGFWSNPDLLAIVEKDISGVWTEVHRDSTVIPNLPAVQSEFISDTLTDDSWVSLGDFRVTYEVRSTSDGDASNNTIQHFFSINDDMYASKVERDAAGLPVINSSVFPGGPSFSKFEMGSTFDFPLAGTNAIQVDSISQGFLVLNNYSGAASINYSVRLYEWTDVNGDSSIDASNELNLVALGTDTLLNVTNLTGSYVTQKTAVYDVNNLQSGYVLSDATVYLATVSLSAVENGLTTFNSNDMVWLGCSNEENYGMNNIYNNVKASFIRLDDPVNGEILNDVGFGVRRVSSLGLHLGEACLPVVASMSFIEDFLEVDFTDASTSQTNPIDSWSWDFGDGTTSTVQNPSHTYAAPGQYEVCLTITNLCSSNTYCDSVEVVANTAGLTDAWMENVIVYPVPASEVLKVKNIPAGAITVELRNIVGQLIYMKTFGQGEEIEVPVFNLASGQYNLMILSEFGVLNKSVLVR